MKANPTRVLVVDDEVELLDVLKDFFQMTSYELVLSSTGEEAIACLGEQSFDAVLTDINRPVEALRSRGFGLVLVGIDRSRFLLTAGFLQYLGFSAGKRQPETEGAAFARFTLDPNPPAMLFNNPF